MLGGRGKGDVNDEGVRFCLAHETTGTMLNAALGGVSFLFIWLQAPDQLWNSPIS